MSVKKYFSSFLTRILRLTGFVKTLLDYSGVSFRLYQVFILGSFVRSLRFEEIKIENSRGKDAFIDLFRQMGLKANQSLLLSFSGASIHAISFDLPGVREKELNTAIQWELKKKLPLPDKDVYYSHKKMADPFARKQKRWNITALVVKKEELDNILESLRSAGILAEKVFLMPFHSLRILSIPPDSGNLGLFILSDHTLEIYLLHSGKVFDSLFYSFDIQHVSPMTVKNIIDFIIQFEKKSGEKLNGLYLLNKEKMFPDNLKQAVEKAAGVSLSPAEKILPSFGSIKGKERIHYLDSLGLLLRPDPELEITPAPVKKEFLKNSIIKGLAAALVLLNLVSLAILPTLIGWMQEYQRIQDARSGSSSMDSETQNLAKLLTQEDELIQMKQKQVELTEKIQALENTGIPSSKIRYVLYDLARLMLPDTRILRLRLMPPRAELDGEAPNSEEMEDLIKNLSLSKKISNIILKRADLNQEKGKSILFTLQFEVKS